MLSLFSVFDFMLFYMNLIAFLMSVILISCNSKIHTSFRFYIFSFYFFMSKFFHSLSKYSYNEFLFTFMFLLFFMMIFINFSSVLSFNFPLTSLPSFVFFFSLSIWLLCFFMNILSNLKGFLSHCIPEGSPLILSVFLFLIEIVSNTIRPITLGVRMCANILAGHLLMILLSQLVLKFLFIVPLFLILNLVEMFVALIQSYIFVTLASLYLSEVN